MYYDQESIPSLRTVIHSLMKVPVKKEEKEQCNFFYWLKALHILDLIDEELNRPYLHDDLKNPYARITKIILKIWTGWPRFQEFLNHVSWEKPKQSDLNWKNIAIIGPFAVCTK